MERGSGLEGKITSSALDKLCYRGWKVNQIVIFRDNKKYEIVDVDDDKKEELLPGIRRK